MEIIDTHVHLYDPAYAADLKEVIQRAKAQRVNHYILAGVNSATLQQALALHALFNQETSVLVGLHPCDVQANYEEELNELANYLTDPRCRGIGEIGLDYYHDKTFITQQKAALQTQLEWAKQYNYPISFHVRNALPDVLEVLKTFLPYRFTGVFHCFSGSYEEAQTILRLGNFKLGVGGVITFKNSHLPETIKRLGLAHIVVETDGPYLAPVPHRGTRNEPAYLEHVVQKLGAIFELDYPEVVAQLHANTRVIFHYL